LPIWKSIFWRTWLSDNSGQTLVKRPRHHVLPLRETLLRFLHLLGQRQTCRKRAARLKQGSRQQQQAKEDGFQDGHDDRFFLGIETRWQLRGDVMPEREQEADQTENRAKRERKKPSISIISSHITRDLQGVGRKRVGLGISFDMVQTPPLQAGEGEPYGSFFEKSRSLKRPVPTPSYRGAGRNMKKIEYPSYSGSGLSLVSGAKGKISIARMKMEERTRAAVSIP
jgi:hypothetical protein